MANATPITAEPVTATATKKVSKNNQKTPASNKAEGKIISKANGIIVREVKLASGGTKLVKERG